MGYFKEYWKGGEGQTEGAYHSSFFHSYFEGYVEQKQSDPRTGRTKIVRIYTAPYRVRCASDAQWRTTKLGTMLLYLSSVVFLILAATALELENPAKYYQLFVAGSLVCDFFLLYILFRFLSAPRKMTIGDYRAVYPKLYRMALASAVFTVLAFLARLINEILISHPINLKLIMGFFCLVGSAITMAFLFFREKNAIYNMEDNEHAEENGFQVQR